MSVLLVLTPLLLSFGVAFASSDELRFDNKITDPTGCIPGFHVPELPLGTLTALVAMLVIPLAIYLVRSRTKADPAQVF